MRLVLHKGWCLVFDALLVHGGCGYDEANYRLHFYLSATDNQLQYNKDKSKQTFPAARAIKLLISKAQYEEVCLIVQSYQQSCQSCRS